MGRRSVAPKGLQKRNAPAQALGASTDQATSREAAWRLDVTNSPTQDAPLTPEYQAIFKANIEDQHAGGQGTNATSTCLAPGMPMVMNAHSPMEIIVMPETTYIRVDHIRDDLQGIARTAIIHKP